LRTAVEWIPASILVTTRSILRYQNAPMAEAAKPVTRRPPPRPAQVEAKPIIAGRMWIAVAMLCGMGVIANPPFNDWVKRKFAPAEDLRTDFTKWKVGSETDVRVTLITGDSTRLSCAKAEVVEGAYCAFGTDRLPRAQSANDPADDNGPNRIQPYRTSPDNALILVAGLWAHPDVAMRLHREPPNVIPTKRQNRFDVTCRVKFLTKWDQVELRWDSAPGTTWQTERGAWVTRALHCTVNNS
jgi:hypothetical protein